MRTRTGLTAMAAMMVLALAAPAAHGAVAFERTDYSVGGTANSLAVGDIDGKDGPDIVAVRYDTGLLVRRLNDGSGHFTTTGQSFTACQADQVELADVTSDGTDYVRDGKLDAVLFCVDSGKLARMAGDGAGGFGAPHLGTAFLNSPSLASADHFALGAFTDYDRPPLALYRTQDGQYHGVLCALYDYSSDLQCLSPPPSGTWPAIGGPMLAVDFRGDNQQELLTVGGSRGLVVFGIVDVPTRVWTNSEIDFGQSVGGALALAVGDLNGDGRPDVITGTGSSSAGVVNTITAPAGQSLVNTAPKSFPSIVGLFHLVTGDFDGDGHVDVLAAGGYGHAAVHAGDGAGGLGAPQDIPLAGAGNAAYATVVDAVAADVDRNGTADAVVLDDLYGTFEVLRNLVPPPAPVPGGGPPGPVPVLPATPAAPKLAPVAPKSNPLDGLSGLVSSTTADSAFTLMLGKAANPPTRAVALTLTVSGASASARRKPTVVGTATVAIPAGKSRLLRVKLNAKGRALLRRHAKLAVTVTYLATGANGAKQSRTRKVTAKRHRARR
jgi:hypothetical protein